MRIFLLLLLLLVSCTLPPQSPPRLTLEKYNCIEAGMTLEEIEEIMNMKAIELSRSEVAGVISSTYKFEGAQGFPSIVVTVSDGKVLSKSQFGLE